MRIVVIGNYPESIISFRGALLQEFVKAGHEVIACAPGDHGDVPERLERMGIAYLPLHFDRTGTNPLKDFCAFVKFVQMFRKLRPDVALFYTIKPVIFGSLAAWLTGVHYIYSIITGLGYVFIGNSWKQKLIKPIVCTLYRRALSRNKNIFFLNRDDQNTFYSLGIIENIGSDIYIHGEGIDLYQYKGYKISRHDNGDIENYIVLNGSGVDVRHYAPFGEVDIKPQSFLLIARLIRDKGIMEYVEAARILSAKYDGVKFQLIGPFDSNPSAISPSQIEEWSAEGVIEYLGEKKDVRPFIESASVYVLPSYREGLPRTVLEAMAMGTPIITTDAPGCRETVTDGDNGFLVPVKDAEALAAAMERFILQPELIEKMGRRSRAIAEERYDVRKVNAVILKTMGL